MKVKVKVCGLTREEDVGSAVEAGADALGFVVGVPSSPRNLSVRRAGELMKKVPIFVEKVLVTVPRAIWELERMVRKLNPDCLQLHGGKNFPVELRKVALNLPIIKAFRAGEDEIPTIIEESEFYEAILVDSSSPSKLGGTGKTHDWGLSRKVRDGIYPKPLILAGGLNANNVQEAIKTVKPYGVDVSSGVEVKPGVKSFEKMVSFVEAAKKWDV